MLIPTAGIAHGDSFNPDILTGNEQDIARTSIPVRSKLLSFTRKLKCSLSVNCPASGNGNVLRLLGIDERVKTIDVFMRAIFWVKRWVVIVIRTAQNGCPSGKM